jgi:hypothetical protein
MDEGKLELFSGIGIITRGDLVLCVHPADTNAERNIWLDQQIEDLSEPERAHISADLRRLRQRVTAQASGSER